MGYAKRCDDLECWMSKTASKGTSLGFDSEQGSIVVKA